MGSRSDNVAGNEGESDRQTSCEPGMAMACNPAGGQLLRPRPAWCLEGGSDQPESHTETLCCLVLSARPKPLCVWEEGISTEELL